MNTEAYFAMGLHFHQPVGNFERILERAYRDCYRPFLEVLAKYPEIRMTFHFSGNLLDYFEAHHPEFLDWIDEFVRSGQVEMMGGGYYEPIFQAIPRRDRIGQIEMLSDYIERRFGKGPDGIWIPERVWSPDLVEDLYSCGVRYCILDDTHLINAGVGEEGLNGYFMTGPADSRIAVFPSDTFLRYSMPFKSPRETLGHFRGKKKEGKGRLFIYGDDGEKFGEWPWTHDWVYKKGWLDNFFKELRKNQRWLKTVTFSEYLDSHGPLGEKDIPESSYREMMEWSGGRWLNFLSRYPESNHMHKRMIYVSERLDSIGHRAKGIEKLQEAKRELYKGQTNCPYWHGVFGGIYLYHLRKAVYEHLINADKIMDSIECESHDDRLNLKEMDFYDRGSNVVICENNDFFVAIDPQAGGSIKELDCKKVSSNLINTLARRREDYHKKIIDKIKHQTRGPVELYDAIKIMDKRIAGDIFYDSYGRSCLVDHFIKRDLTREEFEDCRFIDIGGFADAPYTARIEGQGLILQREGRVERRTIALSKEIGIISGKGLRVVYILKNKDSSPVDTSFGTEFNLSMPYADSDRYSYQGARELLGGLDKRGSVSHADSFSIKDSKGELSVEFMFSGRPEKIWYFPVMTVSQSERAYDLNYQASCIFPVWDIRLQGGEEVKFDITWSMMTR